MKSRDVNLLDPYLKDSIEYAIGQWKVRFPNLPEPFCTQTHRSVGYQNCLFAQGRDDVKVVNQLRKEQGLMPINQAQNKIVTNARGGTSKHNAMPSKAYDIAFRIKGTKKLDWSESLFSRFYDIVKERYPKVVWGGHFRSLKDLPHFEIV
jgi:hypothetical protein